MPNLGPAELIIILLIVILIFGAGKLAEVGGALGRGIREFRKSIREEEESAPTPSSPSAASDKSRTDA
jgi:sec-independent protein translocase protein TatA